jgi:hypothetical protein
MANVTKETFLGELRKRYGKIHRLDTSLSLYDETVAKYIVDFA